MGSRYDFPSPRGEHVPDADDDDDDDDADDPYRRPPSRRNRYSRSVHQTPRHRDVAWISSPESTSQAPHALRSPWQPPPQAPSTPFPRPPSAIAHSPAPTVGEHMTVDELADAGIVEPYPHPQRPGLIRSFWRGLKKLSRFHSGPSFPSPSFPNPSFPNPWPSSYEDQAAEAPVPVLRAPSEATQYVNPVSSGTTTEQRSTTPYTSPYVRPANVRAATPVAIPASLRASPVPIPTPRIPGPVTVISLSNPSSPRAASARSVRVATPGPGPRRLSVGAQEPAVDIEEGSQTLHEPVYLDPARTPVIAAPVPVRPTENVPFPFPVPPGGTGGGGGLLLGPDVERTSSKGSLASTMARVRRFVADVDGLPWVSEAQIVDAYVPEMNPRSRMRTRVRQGADPSWYNPRPEVAEKPQYWSEWDAWANRSAAALWDGGRAGRVGWAGVGAVQGQPVYPHGYVPAQPGPYPFGYPLPRGGRAP